MPEKLATQGGSPMPTCRRRRLASGTLILIVAMAGVGIADDDLTARRFALMRERVASGKVESDEPDFPRAFAPEPIFRYADPALGYVTAAVWKLGNEGRPKALLATELRRKVPGGGKPAISYEFSSLTSTPFSLRSDDMDWSPASTRFEFKPILKAPAPEATPGGRMAQFRAIAGRFSSRKVARNQPEDLRLLPIPVDRYTPSGTDRADGAIFFFASGRNPEVVLLIESNGERWSYAAGRMTAAQEVALRLDGNLAWKETASPMARDSSFTGVVIPVDLPGLAEGTGPGKASGGEFKNWGTEVDLDDDVEIEATADTLTIRIPGTPHVLSSEETDGFSAPRVVSPVRREFVATVRVDGEFRPSRDSSTSKLSSRQAGGLLLLKDADNYIVLQRRTVVGKEGKLHRQVIFDERKGGKRGVTLDQPSPDGPVFLRLGRKEGIVTAAFSGDGKQWTTFKPIDAQWSRGVADVGVVAVNTSVGPHVLTFDEYSLEAK